MRYLIIAAAVLLATTHTISYMTGKIVAGEARHRAERRYDILSANTDYVTTLQSEAQFQKEINSKQ